MEHLIAVLLIVFAVGFAVQLVGLEWFARLMVGSATAHLPYPLRDRVAEECRSEIRELRGPWPKLYIVLTCFLDAVRLQRMWRAKQLRNMAGKDPSAAADRSGGRSRINLDDTDCFTDGKEDRDLPNIDLSRTGGSQSRKASPRSFAIALKSRLAIVLRQNAYKPQYRTNQKLLMLCCGKVFRLDGGIWVNDW